MFYEKNETKQNDQKRGKKILLRKSNREPSTGSKVKALFYCPTTTNFKQNRSINYL